MSQVPYAPPVAPSADGILATAKETAEEIHLTPSLLAFIALRQRGALGTLPEELLHPEDALLQSYVEERILVNTGPPWWREAL